MPEQLPKKIREDAWKERRREWRHLAGNVSWGLPENRAKKAAKQAGKFENRTEKAATQAGKFENRAEKAAKQAGKFENRTEKAAKQAGKFENRTEKPGKGEIDYSRALLAPRQILGGLGAGAALDLIIARLFYRSWFAAIFFSPLILAAPVYFSRSGGQARRERLAAQFRDGALALASALTAGYAIENAWREAAAEMVLIYGEEGEITREFVSISRKIARGQTSEQAVENLAARSGVAEIRQFAEVFSAAKRSSGSLAPILKDTAVILARKIRVREEIRTMSAAKQLEFSVMCVMPAAILLYVNLGSPGFTDPLYGTLAGRGIMSICLIIYGLAIWLGRKILEVEV